MTFFEKEFADMTCLVHDDVQKIYVPHGKDWVKSRLFQYLRRYATKESS